MRKYSFGNIYITGEMDPLGGSVPPGQNLTVDGSEWNQEHKHLDRIYEKQICSYVLKEHLILYSSFKMYFYTYNV